MATLLSPGVSVSFTNEAISSTSSAGTVPLFVIASAQDKLVTGSSTIASGTTAASAGTLQIVTSQKNTLELFGTPVFQTSSSGSVVQGDELNEYGLHAVYSYMGIANRAYVLRADIDMNQLAPSGVEPTGPVPNGTMWLDLYASQIEAYVANVPSPASFHDWSQKTVALVNAASINDIDTSLMNIDDLVARYNPSTGELMMYSMTSTGLAQVDTVLSPINRVPTSGKVWVRQGYTKNGSQYYGTRLVMRRYGSTTNVWTEVPVYAGGSFYDVESQTGILSSQYIAAKWDASAFSFKFYMASGTAAVVTDGAVPVSTAATSDTSLTFKYLSKSVTVKIVSNGATVTAADIISALRANGTALLNDGFSFSGTDSLVVTNLRGYSFQTTQTGFAAFTPAELAKLTIDSYNYSALNTANIKAGDETPVSTAKVGTYWFNFNNSDNIDVALVEADSSTGLWTDVPATNKYLQVDEPAADRDYWIVPLSQGIDGFDFYRNVNGEWQKIDSTDQSTLNGILFFDMTDADAVPSANLYMDGMVGVDLGRSEGVVRRMTSSGWKVVSGTDTNGAGLFGRAAQRAVIVKAMAAVVAENDDIRSESVNYNLICAPGYVELLPTLLTLNTDRRETAFIVTDVPFRLKPTASAINAWANNTSNAPADGELGRITNYDYAAQYMGTCLSTNVDGASVAVPGSTVAMRTFAYSDSISYVWFSPAGTRRGVVNNASSVGYINAESEYVPVVYGPGQRDAMYPVKINPIAMRPNRGLLVYGDKTLSPDGDASAMSRINVARMVAYVRRQIELMSEPFLFRLNTASTRAEFLGIVNNFLGEIARLEGLEDFLVVCDESNNTQERINRNELWMDIALVPTSSINFIYVPVRLQTNIGTTSANTAS